jgi:hypothetical protein
LKNFIRQGKQAQATYGSAPPTDKPGGSAVDTDDHSLTTVTSRKEKYDVVSRQIVEEERKQQSRKPQYPGLDRFRLGEKMGDGAFSVVYKATEVQTGHDVAIKIVRKQDISASQVCFHCFFIFPTFCADRAAVQYTQGGGYNATTQSQKCCDIDRFL